MIQNAKAATTMGFVVVIIRNTTCTEATEGVSCNASDSQKVRGQGHGYDEDEKIGNEKDYDRIDQTEIDQPT